MQSTNTMTERMRYGTYNVKTVFKIIKLCFITFKNPIQILEYLHNIKKSKSILKNTKDDADVNIEQLA